MEQKENHISVKLDCKDIRDLKKTVTYMKKDLSAYPSGGRTWRRSQGMSPARYQLAFRKYYGTTPYEYLKEYAVESGAIPVEKL
ncbi:MAG: hypothetical protein ACLTQL_11245 [Eisenbergiella sp.]